MRYEKHHDNRPAAFGRAALAGLLLVALSACGSGSEAPAPGDPAGASAGQASAAGTDSEKASYSLGYRFAENVQRQFEDSLDADAFAEGVRDRLAGDPAQVDDAEAERVLTALMEQRQAQADSRALESLEEGLAFLEENASREEVVTLESGLQYEVLQEAEGAKPAATDVVSTHYEGRLIDGTVFDSSYQRGAPAQFPLDQVIPGWTEGLQLMSPGAKYRLYVPSALAYGESGAGQVIPPNAALVFDVELLEIVGDGVGTPDAPDANP